MVTQLQPDVRAYLHGGEVIKRYIRIEEVAHEYGFSVEELLQFQYSKSSSHCIRYLCDGYCHVLHQSEKLYAR